MLNQLESLDLNIGSQSLNQGLLASYRGLNSIYQYSKCKKVQFNNPVHLIYWRLSNPYYVIHPRLLSFILDYCAPELVEFLSLYRFGLVFEEYLDYFLREPTI